MGATKGGGGGFGFYGAARGRSSRALLDIGWLYPRYQPPALPKPKGAKNASRSVRARSALPAEQAYKEIAGDDRRPLLVLRECLTCTGTDDALLTKQADNEKTMLMSRWFHCVKLPPDVLEENHPFHALFTGDDPGHLFVSRWDGSGRLDLNGAQSRTELWDVMGRVLASTYADPAEEALGKLQALLGEMDKLDGEIDRLEKQLEAKIDKYGPKSRKLTKIQKELAKLRTEADDLRAEALEVSRLQLREREGAEQAGSSRDGDESA